MTSSGVSVRSRTDCEDLLPQLRHRLVAAQEIGQDGVAVNTDGIEDRGHGEAGSVFACKAMRDHRTTRPEQRNDLPHSALRAAQCREPLILLGHESLGGDGDVFIVGLLGHHLLEGRLVRRLTIRGDDLVEVKQVYFNSRGHGPFAVTLHFAC